MRLTYITLLILATALTAALPTKAQTVSERALLLYPHSAGVPDDVAWSREIYRSLDLTKGDNGSLYYPTEPSGDNTNLFSLMFKLLAGKKITAYEYQLDGVEHFEADHAVRLADILDRFGIYYEQKRLKGSKDSVLVMDNSDIPSADVLSYFIKEVWYFDQRTSTFGSAVTAICPVMHRAEEFSSEKVKMPMFWIRYQDIAPYLATTNIVTSRYNNSKNRSMDDFFATRSYEGDIYKTTNLRNESLAQYCNGDSAILREQQRIEREIELFEKGLYGTDTTKVKSAQADKVVKGNKTQTTTKQKSSTSSNTKRRGGTQASAKSSATVKSTNAPKATVRRERK
jgi:gliding motility associated protien GldN